MNTSTFHSSSPSPSPAPLPLPLPLPSVTYNVTGGSATTGPTMTPLPHLHRPKQGTKRKTSSQSLGNHGVLQQLNVSRSIHTHPPPPPSPHVTTLSASAPTTRATPLTAMQRQRQTLLQRRMRMRMQGPGQEQEQGNTHDMNSNRRFDLHGGGMKTSSAASASVASASVTAGAGAGAGQHKKKRVASIVSLPDGYFLRRGVTVIDPFCVSGMQGKATLNFVVQQDLLERKDGLENFIFLTSYRKESAAKACEWMDTVKVGFNNHIILYERRESSFRDTRYTITGADNMDKPANLTPAIRVGENVLHVATDLLCDEIYEYVVEMMIPEKLETIQDGARVRAISKESTMGMVAKQLDPTSDDLVCSKIFLSLKCPVSLSRIQFPVRGLFCTHAQCFDLTTHISLNRHAWKSNKEMQWLCPCCHVPAMPQELCYDQFFAELLDTVESDVDVVVINAKSEVIEKKRDGVIVETSQGSDAETVEPRGKRKRTIDGGESDDSIHSIGDPSRTRESSSRSSSRSSKNSRRSSGGRKKGSHNRSKSVHDSSSCGEGGGGTSHASAKSRKRKLCERLSLPVVIEVDSGASDEGEITHRPPPRVIVIDDD